RVPDRGRAGHGPAPAHRRRTALRHGHRGRARRRPHLRQGHHPRRGRLLSRTRPAAELNPSGGVVTEVERLGVTVTHRRYVPYSHAHYGGNLVDGAYVLVMFGDVATEVCIRTDADEGLFASYDDVQFRAPVRAGDVLEATATVTRVGRRSRTIAFEARVVCR